MMESGLHPMPRPRDVLFEQIRAVGLALRREALVAAVLVSLASIGVVNEILREGDVIDFHPEHWILPGLLGLVLPIGVWKGQKRFGDSLFWTLPVERRRHALTRVFAGWTWLMGVVAMFMLGLLGLTLFSGGNILAEETLRFIPSSSIPPPGARVDAAALQTVRWTPEPLLWLVPFTAATGTYLLASALALGLRHRLRWMAGAVLLLFLIGGVGEMTNTEWLIFAPSRLLAGLLHGPYGLDALLTASTDFFKLRVTLSTGEAVVVWRELPDLSRWATATLLWTTTGLIALWAAASRHRG